VLRLFDGHRSLEQVVQDSSLPDLETLTLIQQLRERGMLDPRVTPPPPLPLPPGSQRSPRSQRSSATRDEPSELSFVPLAASLGMRHEPHLARRWVWGLVCVGATTLGLALALRYADQQRRSAQRAARTALASAGEPSVPKPSVPSAPPAAGAGTVQAVVPLPAVSQPAPATPATASCPEGTAQLLRPATRDSEAESYCLDRYEVTAAAYAQCVNASGCVPARREVALPEAALTAAARRRARSAFGAQCNSGESGRGSHPMNCLTFEEAESYCRWRGGKLPSEGEWEFGAGGVNGRPFPWGGAPPSPTLLNACGSECKSWYASAGLQPVFEGVMYEGSDGYAGTAPVGSFPGGGTPEGIQDLIGNVAEWTTGRVEGYDAEPGGVAVASHIVRGGAFTSSQAALAAPVLRQYSSADERDRSVGFRCAYSL